MKTVLSLQCIDQTLQPVNLPKLASGGQQEIRVEFSFCSLWSGLGKTATFFRDEQLVYHAALVNDACLIPWGVMAKPGRVYVGVYGVSGETVRTSEVLPLNVEQGALTGAFALDPSADVYRQLLTAYGSAAATSAINSARLDVLAGGATIDDAELLDMRVGADGMSYSAAGEAQRAQLQRAERAAASPSLYDLDVVREHMGLVDLCPHPSVVGRLTDATATWQYASKVVPLPVGTYTVVIRDLLLPATGFFAIKADTQHTTYLERITEPGVYVIKVYDDGEYYKGGVTLLLQMAQDSGEAPGTYHANGISIYAGDITILQALPEHMTGADRKLDKWIGKNLFNADSPDIVMGRFLSGGGVLTENEYSPDYYVTGFIPIEELTTYALTDYRIGGAFIVFYNASKSFISGMQGGSELGPAGGIFTTPEGAAYIRLTGNIANLSTNQLEKGDAITTWEPYTEYAPVGDLAKQVQALQARALLPAVKRATAETMADGGSLSISTPNVKNWRTISFAAAVGKFSGLTISHGKTAPYCSAYVTIDAAAVKVYEYTTEPKLLATHEHGLAIADRISVTVNVSGGASAELRLVTPGGSFSKEIPWNGSNGDIVVESNGSTLTDCDLVYYMAGLSKSVWLYGDSYFDYWPEVLAGSGYTNYSLDGYSGRNSLSALESLKASLQYARPQRLVWCMGMNDADNGAINANWLSACKSVEAICADLGIELVMSTVPNVPGRDHRYKNEYVRASGYRFIDFSAAVGADAAPGWLTGLLGGDDVHPTASGATVLTARALVDVPELAEVGAAGGGAGGNGIVSIEKTDGTGAPGTDDTYTITMTDGSTFTFKVHNGADGSGGAGGSGDMSKSVYDTDNDGVVDDSDKLGGQLPSYYARASHSHSEYAPLSHTHSEYAPTGHTHTEYAPVQHTHTEYAPAGHEHLQYAIATDVYTKTEADAEHAETLAAAKAYAQPKCIVVTEEPTDLTTTEPDGTFLVVLSAEE